MAPQVRNLQDLIAQYSASFDPQRQLIDADIEMNAKAGAAQEQGLEAKKTKSFGQIEQNAQSKGMLFSGFTPDAQATYTADTYLPALANLQAAIAGTRSSLLGKKAELDSTARTQALGAQEGDIAAVRSWQTMQEQARLAAEQAAKERAFTAAENERNRRAAAADSAANRAAAASKGSSGPTASQMMSEALSAKTGSDGYVSPGTYSSMKNQWVAGGYGKAKDFDAAFAGYRNPKNKYYKLG